MKKKKIVYVDMDGVLVDFARELRKRGLKTKGEIDSCVDNTEGFFLNLKPMQGAIKAFEWLSMHFDTYILTTAPWKNVSALSDKRRWVGKYLPELAEKRLIITHNKELNKGDYMIDDRIAKGVEEFEGKHIHFGQKDFPDWETVLNFFVKREKLQNINFDHELLDEVYEMYRKERIGYNTICERCKNTAIKKRKQLINGPLPILHIGKNYRRNKLKLLVIGTVAYGWDDIITDFEKDWKDVYEGNKIEEIQSAVEKRVKELFTEDSIKIYRYLKYALTNWYVDFDTAYESFALTNYVHCNPGKATKDKLPVEIIDYCAHIDNNGFFAKEIDILKPTHIIGLAKPTVTKYAKFLDKQLDRNKWNYVNIEHPSSPGRSYNGFKNDIINFLAK